MRASATAILTMRLLLTTVLLSLSGNSEAALEAAANAETEIFCTVGSSEEDGSCYLSEQDTLVKWIQSLEGGSVSVDKFRIETAIDYPDGSLNPEFDFFATEDIPKGTILMEIPPSAVIGNLLTPDMEISLQQYAKAESKITKEEKPHFATCIAIDVIVNERIKGKKSKYHPYLEFLFGKGNPEGKKPAEWSHVAQFIFWGIVGQINTLYTPNMENHKIKHPVICNNYKKMYKQDDSKERKSLEKLAYYYFAKHAWGTNLIPLFDMIPHRNGKWKNVEARYVDLETGAPISISPRNSRFQGLVREDGVGVNDISAKAKIVVYADRDIAVGEPLRVSYNQCEHLGCEYLKLNYTSSNIIADMGIVEEYPRRWSLSIDPLEENNSNDYMIFDIDVDPQSGDKTFELLQDSKRDDEIYKIVFIDQSVGRWEGLEYELDEHLEDWKNETAHREYEYKGIYGYYSAYTEAFVQGWLHRDDKVGKNQNQNTIEGYDDLSEPSGLAVNSKGTYMACAEGEIIDDGMLIGEANSFYQKLEYFYEKDIHNTYMKMGGWIHSGSNFRAHYHESVIHVALQYVEEPKRVAYIGGGDNLPLAEILKYPSIEKVIGMEIDQQVCRSSMKFFGSTPRFDDDRVEWWYGNGAISMQLIPEDYFGSFDLVMVDLLTDVAEAIKVTADLSLVDVAPLLMNPNGGVLTRNEDIVDRSEISKRLAKRVVMYDHYDFPRLCEGSMTLASNSVDFARGKRYKHDVKTVKRLENFEEEGFEGWAQYFDSTTKSWSTFDPRVCNKIKKALPAHNEARSSSVGGGALLVIEAENVTVALEPERLPELHRKIEQIARDHGMSPITTIHDPVYDVNAFILPCKQGYIKMQTYPEHKYIAFDLVLSGGNPVMEKSEAIQNDLVTSIGGGNLENSVSTFRVSTGGLGGDDEIETTKSGGNHKRKDNGLVEKAIAYYCGTKSSSAENSDTNENTGDNNSGSQNKKHTFNHLYFFLHFITSNIQGGKKNYQPAFAIFCGKKTDDNCQSYASISTTREDGSTQSPKKDEHTTFFPIYSCESFEDMVDCESKFSQNIFYIVSKHKRLDGFVLDESVPLEMGKIIHKTFNNTVNQGKIFEREFSALAPGDESSWRNIFLDRFRTEIIIAPPTYKADFQLAKGGHSEVWSVVSVRNKKFMDTLQKSLHHVQLITGWATSTKKILSSVKPLITDWLINYPDDSDFFDKDAMEQWFNQRPLANQFLIQMELGSARAPLEVGEMVLVGSAFVTDGGFANQKGFMFNMFEATVVGVNEDDNYVTEIKSQAMKNGKPLTTTKTVPRRQIRKLSSTEHNRYLDAGDLVLMNQPDAATGEMIPHVWHSAFVRAMTDDGVLIRPKHGVDLTNTLLEVIPRENILVYQESPEFMIRKEGFSWKELGAAFDEAIVEFGLEKEGIYLKNVKVGSGYLVGFVTPKGSGTMTWDGAYRLDINMLLTDGPFEEDFNDRISPFSEKVRKLLPNLDLIAQDSFPRGYGKVVNFQHEMVRKNSNGDFVDYVPIWMNEHLNESMTEGSPEIYYLGNDLYVEQNLLYQDPSLDDDGFNAMDFDTYLNELDNDDPIIDV